MMSDEACRALYRSGLADLSGNAALGAGAYGLHFILPFSVTVVRSGTYGDAQDWLAYEGLNATQRKSVQMLSLALGESGERPWHLYEAQPDYHALLYPIYTWHNRFTGQDVPPVSATTGMLKRPIATEREPIERHYLQQEMASIHRDFSPIACAVALVRMVNKEGLDSKGEPQNPADGYLSASEGD